MEKLSDELLQIADGLLQFGLELIAFPIDGCPTFRCATQTLGTKRGRRRRRRQL